MTSGSRRRARTLRFALHVAPLFALLCGAGNRAAAHSASDAYLTVDAAASPTAAPAAAAAPRAVTFRVQWDIALRDLDFVMKLDDDGDGRIVWKELRRHQPQIARYALSQIGFERNGKACAVKLVAQQVDDHADGAYAALFIDVSCSGPATPVTLDYRLFFAIDPSHRAILVSRSGGDVATALLSPQNAHVDLRIGTAPAVGR